MVSCLIFFKSTVHPKAMIESDRKATTEYPVNEFLSRIPYGSPRFDGVGYESHDTRGSCLLSSPPPNARHQPSLRSTATSGRSPTTCRHDHLEASISRRSTVPVRREGPDRQRLEVIIVERPVDEPPPLIILKSQKGGIEQGSKLVR